jgi:arylsulfatase A-like enzyme
MKAIVVQASGLHLGFLGCYGNDWIATPNLDRLAAEGIVFDQHYVASLNDVIGPGLLPGVSQQRFSNLETFAHDAGPSLRTLVETDGVLWIDGPDLAPPWRLATDILSSYLDEDDEEAVEPWPDPPIGEAPEEFDVVRLQDTYAAAVTWFDAQLGVLFDEAKRLGIYDSVWWCFTASSGLPLGEHGRIGIDRPWLHEEAVHVPMIWRLPGAAEACARISALTQTIDLVPSIAHRLGLSALSETGLSLWPLVRGEAESVREVAVATAKIADGEEWMLRSATAALVLPISGPDDEPRKAQLYAKPDDRWEVNDVSSRQPEETETLEKVLREKLNSRETVTKDEIPNGERMTKHE